MADNTQLPVPATSGDVIGADDIGGIKYQRIKMIKGADGVNDGDISDNNPFPVVLSGPSINSGGVPYFTTAREKFRDAFLTYDTTNNWTTVSTGSGMAITTAGAANGARYLNISSGTTINSETIIISKTRFKAPCSVIVGLSMSQRIANCDAFIEIVEVDTNGNVITDSTQASARFKDARNGASFQFNGTTATTQTVNVRQDGLTEVTATGTYTTTAATGTNPNFIPAGLFEITLRNRDVQFSSVAIDSNAAKTAPLARTMRVPNPDALYALRIRVLNGGTAPASSTDVRIHSVVITDDTRLSVDFGNIAGLSNLLNALPVQVANALTVSLSGSSIITPVVNTGQGLSTYHHLIAAGTNNLTSVKTTAGVIGSITLTNAHTSGIYFKLYNKASAPVLASDTPIKTVFVPANSAIHLNFAPFGLRLATGIAYATTTGIAINDTGAITANVLAIGIDYA